jgi:hypothetical protein
VNYSSDEEDTPPLSKEEIEDLNGSDDDDDDDDTEYTSCSSSENSSDEATAAIHQFPVQMICLEKCDGTLDELFEQGEMNPTNGASALIQIIFSLLIYQKAFHFTHNDLHTNNIMFIHTKIKHIYYIFEKKIYKVPTYGKIFKLIDFGRSIYQFRGRKFCSDSFATGGDAATQYNTEPFLVEGKPRLDPNFSFDLSRLGCSIYDFIIDGEQEQEMDEFQKTISRWCKDDNGKNLLYMKNGKERYPNFKLYKMIARTVHFHTPGAQLSFPFFSQFLCSKIGGKDGNIVNIDDIPCYL